MVDVAGAQRLLDEGFERAAIRITAHADIRYRGQSAEITLPFRANGIDVASLAELTEAFEREYQNTFGHRGGTAAFEFVTARLTGTVERRLPSDNRWQDAPAVARSAMSFRRAYFGPEHGFVQARIAERSALGAQPVPGPLLIVEYDTTVVVPPGCSASCDAAGTIVIGVPAPSREAGLPRSSA